MRPKASHGAVNWATGADAAMALKQKARESLKKTARNLNAKQCVDKNIGDNDSGFESHQGVGFLGLYIHCSAVVKK
jgi:hypothetical protein